MNKKGIYKLLEQEVNWCKKNPDDKLSEDYQKGFIKGLEQARFLISTIGKLERRYITIKKERRVKMTAKSDWEKRFDEKFGEFVFATGLESINSEGVKGFIKQELKSQRKAMVKELRRGGE